MRHDKKFYEFILSYLLLFLQLSTFVRSITKDDYDKKLQELKDRQYRLNIELDEHTKADHEYHLHLSTVLNLSRRVKQIFDSSEVNEKRGLIKFLLQNPFVSDRKLVFELRKPFDTVLQLAQCPTVLNIVDSIRTRLIKIKEYMYIPDLG